MKTRRISTHRIGTDSKSRKRRWEGWDVFLTIIFAVLIGMVIAYFYFARPLETRNIIQITIVATTSPLPTTTMPPPTLAALPTPSLVVAPSPAPTPAPVFGIALGDVWLREAPGGDRLPAALLKGQRVEVLEDGGEFLKVQWTDGETELTGWVTAEWIEVQ